jgi:uncharacterized protein
MLKYLQNFLGGLGKLEYKFFYSFIILILLVTAIAGVGFTKLEFESDFSEFDPTEVPVVALDKKVGQKFAGFKSFLVIVELDDKRDSDIKDIRDPKVIEFLVELDKALKEEQKIQSVASAGMFFDEDIPETLDDSIKKLDGKQGSEGFFNSRYSMTPIFIDADVSGDSSKINEMNEKVRDIVESTSKPGGIKVAVTGEPPLLAKIFDLMIQDGIFTLFVATLVIFLMLMLIQRSIKDSIVIVLPVLFGVQWTIGAMGWFGLKITVATAAIGAMLLGLGVEYSIFLNSRYKEEKKSDITIKDALVKTLSTTGASTISSGMTTMIGFFALSLSMFPMLADMGFSLGMGIMLILIAVMVVGPIMIIARDKLFTKGKDKLKDLRKGKNRVEKESIFIKSYEKYGMIITKIPWIVILIFIIITGFMYYGSNFVENEEIDFDSILPEDLAELKAYNLMQEEFSSTSSIYIFIELDQTYIDSDEPTDIRDPRIINYVNILSQKARQMDRVMEVRSISNREKDENNEIIPQSLSEQKVLLEDIRTNDLITEDYTGMLIKVIMQPPVDRENTVLQIYSILENTKKPAGIKSDAVGGLVVGHELDLLIGPDSSFTAIIAFAIIILLLLLLSRSIKYTILPLVTVVVAILWIMGMIGYFKVGWNSIISSVISMTIGIGIDFGIQLSNRFRQELESHDKKTAMCRTLKYTLYPMIITVVAALIGFQAMRFGQLKLMGDLGQTMSFGMVASMIVAVSLVASLMLIFEKDKKK